MLFGQVRIAVFFSGAVVIFFGKRWLSPLEKNGGVHGIAAPAAENRHCLWVTRRQAPGMKDDAHTRQLFFRALVIRRSV